MSQVDIFDGSVSEITATKDPTSSGLEGMDDRMFEKYQAKFSAVVARLDDVGLPKPGQQYRLITRRSFNAIEMLDYIARGERILDLKIAIYSINFYAAQIMMDLVNSGRIERVEILMSNLRNKAHREKEEILKKQFIAHPRISLFYCNSHAKLMACRTESGNHYLIEGSGNHAFNSRVEQYVIDNDPALYDFTCSWMREIKEFLADKKELEIY